MTNGMEHKCEHEADFKHFDSDIQEIKSDIKSVLKVLHGNGQDGITTRLSVMENRNDTQPTPRQTMLFGSVGGGVTTAIVYLARKLIGG